MGSIIDLVDQEQTIDATMDSIVIIKCLEVVPGGASLDVADMPAVMTVVKAGHVIIRETATGIRKPMPVTGDVYAAKPAGYEYEGVLRASVLKVRALASIMVRGSVNETSETDNRVSPYPLTQAIKDALPLIRFTKDF